MSPLAIMFVDSCVGSWRVGALLLGKYGIRRIIPFHNPERKKRVQAWFDKYGAALLIISPRIPFAGDLVPIVAGIEDFNPPVFLIAMFVAKAIKGTAIVYLLSFFVQPVGLHFYGGAT